MVALTNGEFEFRGLRFGNSSSGYPLSPGGFSVGQVTFRHQDQENPSGDGQVPGRDTLNGVIYSWDLTVVECGSNRWKDAARRLSAFRGAWHGSTVRSTPRAVDELKLWHGDRVGLVYGRARNYSEERSHIRQGLAHIVCDFAAMNDLVYEETQESLVLNLVESVGGGLVAPLIAPIVGVGAGNRTGHSFIAGDAATPPIITFFGPITNPRLTLMGRWSVCLATSIAYDQYITVDPRLWSRTVLKAGGGMVPYSVGGLLTRDSISLDRLVLPTGPQEFIFTGIDPTNTGRVSVTWHAARHSV